MPQQCQNGTSRAYFHLFLIALLVFIVFSATNRFFTVLEDEAAIVTAANQPLTQTLRVFATGVGQHEHPPLSDLVLHLWLPVAGVSPTLVRIPSALFYAAALFVLALSAAALAGPTAGYATMIIGALWPFGFHFGRLAGWYSFCLLLIALLTLAYLRWIEQPTWRRWMLVVLCALALVYTNYFGWAIVGLIGLDALFSHRRREVLAQIAAGTALLAAAYAPIWRAFFNELHNGSHAGKSLRAKAVLGAFNFYSLFVSESVAPWFWKLSIVALAAIIVAGVCTFVLANTRARRLLCGFAALFIALDILGVIGTRRLLFISGWLLIAMGVALANRHHPGARRALAASLATIALVGWTGIFTRAHYSSAHFLEPWQPVADSAAQQIAEGDTVVTNSPSFLFYLNASLYHRGLSNSDVPQWADHANILSLMKPLPAGFAPDLSGRVILVRGVNTSAEQQTAFIASWLDTNCRVASDQRLLPEPGFDLKQRFFHSEIGDRYRMRIAQFDCCPPSPKRSSSIICSE